MISDKRGRVFCTAVYNGMFIMKNTYFVAALFMGLVSTGPAFARAGWTAPVNGTVSAVVMSDGGVMMEIKLPSAEFQAIGRDMKLSHDTCIIKDTDTGTADSMVLVCGTAGSKVQ
jgi:uncharacterized membrane protein